MASLCRHRLTGCACPKSCVCAGHLRVHLASGGDVGGLLNSIDLSCTDAKFADVAEKRTITQIQKAVAVAVVGQAHLIWQISKFTASCHFAIEGGLIGVHGITAASC